MAGQSGGERKKLESTYSHSKFTIAAHKGEERLEKVRLRN